MRKILAKFSKTLQKQRRGQSLVELAILAPLAIFMMIGLFEVGWTLRSYIILVNANREATRFAVRPGYLDYSKGITGTIGYDDVLTHANTSLGEQLTLDFETNSKLIISHFHIETNLPCDPEDKKGDPIDINDCDCDAFIDPAANFNASQVYTIDDVIFHPHSPGREYYAVAFPTHTLTSTLLNYEELAAERTRENNKFNCELLKKGGDISVNNFIVTEMTYDHPQLFGFPFISNPLTNPIPLYTHTTMRMGGGARSDNTDIVGPVCDAYPFVVRDITIDYGTPNKIGQLVDIFDGKDSSDWGWLAWNPDTTDAVHLRNELRTGNAPLNDYTNARDSTDHTLSVGDHVASLFGVNATVESKYQLVSSLVGKKIRIPVWDTFDGKGKDRAYHIVGFAWVRIEDAKDIDLPSTKVVKATYLGDASEGCR